MVRSLGGLRSGFLVWKEREKGRLRCVSRSRRGGGGLRARTHSHTYHGSGRWLRRASTEQGRPRCDLSARGIRCQRKAPPMAPHAARVFLKGCPPNSDWEGPKPIPAHRSTSPCTTTQKLHQHPTGTHFSHPHSSTRFQPTRATRISRTKPLPTPPQAQPGTAVSASRQGPAVLIRTRTVPAALTERGYGRCTSRIAQIPLL